MDKRLCGNGLLWQLLQTIAGTDASVPDDGGISRILQRSKSEHNPSWRPSFAISCAPYKKKTSEPKHTPKHTQNPLPKQKREKYKKHAKIGGFRNFLIFFLYFGFGGGFGVYFGVCFGALRYFVGGGGDRKPSCLKDNQCLSSFSAK